MAFQINEEAVSVMRDLAQKIPNSVEGLEKANRDVLSCYEDVRKTVGPHTQEIEVIVQNLNRALKQSSESINEIPQKLNKLIARCEEIIRNRPTQSF